MDTNKKGNEMKFKKDSQGRYFSDRDKLNYMIINQYGSWEVHVSEDHIFDRPLSYRTFFEYLSDAKEFCRNEFT